MIRFQKLAPLALVAAVSFTACKKDKDPVIVVPPSTGSQVQFNGLVGTEAGASAGNAVYFDLSTNTTTAVQRTSWDLAFYCGTEFRVFLNNTTAAGAKVLTATDLNAVGETDTIGQTLSVNQMSPSAADYAFFDNLDGSVTGTVIPEISATDANNKVIILNRGAGGTTARPWIKLRILRNGSGGYTVQYARITATTFQTASVSKDANYHVKLFSFDTGLTLTTGQPEKTQWDLVWSYSLFQTNFGSGMVPYNFSDMIAVNSLSNVQVKEKTYADATAANAAYTAFNRDSINKAENALVSGRWTIGSGWRVTSPSASEPVLGAKLNRFYLIKDANGNYYKLRCLSQGSGTVDGGTRGKPVFKYDLIP